LHPDIHKCIHSIWSKEKLPQQWKESSSEPIYEQEVLERTNLHTFLTLFNNTV
jgi:mannosyltransferase OCH1-like enzyme